MIKVLLKSTLDFPLSSEIDDIVKEVMVEDD